MFRFPDLAHPLAQCPDNESFEARLSSLIGLELTKAPSTSFDALLRRLPSVYPALVLKELRKLGATNSVAAKLANVALTKPAPAILCQSALDRILPVSHPLDCEWRFSDKALSTLGRRIKSLLPNAESIVGLGTPSLINARLGRRVIVIDSNPALTRAFPEAILRGDLFSCNLLTDPLPNLSTEMIVLDPPWYLPEILSFLWAARRICKNEGRVLQIVPQVGTRPGMARDLCEIAKWVDVLGFHVEEFTPNFINYESPLFERLALEQEGVRSLSSVWRRGDLLTLRAYGPVPSTRRPCPVRTPVWQEVDFEGVRIRIVQGEKRVFADPSLISLAKDDEPVSVSRRDKRKERAKVWTSGNRVFDCLGPDILLCLARAVVRKKQISAAVEVFIDRALSQKERAQVKRAIRQMRTLVKVEKICHRATEKAPAIANRLVGGSLTDALPAVLRHIGVGRSLGVGVHLAVFVEPYLEYVLEGSKTVESRFSQARRAPFQQVTTGDLVLMKKSGGAIVGVFEIAQVWSYVLDSASWKEVRLAFTHSLRAQDPAFWSSRADAKFATLMRVENVRRIEPINMPKRDMRGWVVLKGRSDEPNGPNV